MKTYLGALLFFIIAVVAGYFIIGPVVATETSSPSPFGSSVTGKYLDEAGGDTRDADLNITGTVFSDTYRAQSSSEIVIDTNLVVKATGSNNFLVLRNPSDGAPNNAKISENSPGDLLINAGGSNNIQGLSTIRLAQNENVEEAGAFGLAERSDTPTIPEGESFRYMRADPNENLKGDTGDIIVGINPSDGSTKHIIAIDYSAN